MHVPERWSYVFVHVYLQQPVEEIMEVAVYYRDDQQDTHHNTRPKIMSNEITKPEDDASHMVGVIVIKPRGDLSESPLYIGQRTDENQCNTSTHSNHACRCNELLENASGASTRDWGEEYPGVTEKREYPSVKSEGGCAIDSCAGWQLLQSPAIRRGSYIVVEPTTDESQRKLFVKNEVPPTNFTDAVNDCRARCDASVSHPPSRYLLTRDEAQRDY